MYASSCNTARGRHKIFELWSTWKFPKNSSRYLTFINFLRYLFICSIIHSFIYSFTHSFIQLLINVFIYSFIYLLVYLFIYLFIYSFICLLIYVLIHLPLYLFVYSIYLFIHFYWLNLFIHFIYPFIPFVNGTASILVSTAATKGKKIQEWQILQYLERSGGSQITASIN